MAVQADHADFALMDYVQAREKLAAQLAPSTVLRFSVLGPVYPALGCGKLRVLRVRPMGRAAEVPEPETIEVIAGYESYERLEF